MAHCFVIYAVCHAILSVHCNLVVTCWERAGLLTLLYVMFLFCFSTFPCGVLGHVWYVIVSIPELCLLTYFDDTVMNIYLHVLLIV